jgi:MFS family permease
MGAAMRRVQAGNALSAFGTGFTVPFLYVYVAQVRGLGATTAGVVLGAFAVAALFVLPFTGRAIDRRGPLPVVVVAAVVSAAGTLWLGVADTAVTAVLSAVVVGAGAAVIQPALATMIVWCAPPEERTRAFATQFFLMNLGLGIGGLLGGQLVDVDRPGSFVLLFVIEAVMFLVLAGLARSVRLPQAPRVTGARQDETTGRGWRGLLANPAMVRLLVLGFVLFFACYGQFEAGLSAYGTEAAGVSPATLGLALAANTAVIVVAQFVVLRLVERHRRSRVIAAVGVVWALAWLVAGYAGLAHAGQAAGQLVVTVVFVSAYGLFGLGEAMLSPTLAPLVADLAPEAEVGQYNSAFALVKQLALAIGPAVGGPMGARMPFPYVAAFVLCSLAVSVLALRLGRRLTALQDRPSLAPSLVVAEGGPGAGQRVERVAG